MAARTRTGARGGRRPTAAAPRWGHTCFLCPDQPSVLVEAEPGDPGEQEQAWRDFATHLREDHPAVFAGQAVTVNRLGDVSMRTYAGPTVRPQQQAA